MRTRKTKVCEIAKLKIACSRRTDSGAGAKNKASERALLAADFNDFAFML